jgi:hypothetical protein
MNRINFDELTYKRLNDKSKFNYIHNNLTAFYKNSNLLKKYI